MFDRANTSSNPPLESSATAHNIYDEIIVKIDSDSASRWIEVEEIYIVVGSRPENAKWKFISREIARD